MRIQFLTLAILASFLQLALLPAARAASSDFAAADQQMRDNFPSSKIGKFIQDDSAGYQEIKSFVAGLHAHALKELEQLSLLAQTSPNDPVFANKGYSVKPLLACEDISDRFDQVTHAGTTNVVATAELSQAIRSCAPHVRFMRPYFLEHQQTLMKWQQFSRMLQLPTRKNVTGVMSAYRKNMVPRYEKLVAPKTPDIKTQIAATDSSSSIDREDMKDGPLPSEPYQYTWVETAMIQNHLKAIQQEYDPEAKFRQHFKSCQSIIDTPESAFGTFLTLNTWLPNCVSEVGIITRGPYVKDLRAFAADYKSKLALYETPVQKERASDLPDLPSQPYIFTPQEIDAFKNYIRIAKSQSVALRATMQFSGQGGKIYPLDACPGTDTDYLQTDLKNPLIKGNYVSFVNKLAGCANDIAKYNETAGTPLVNRLRDYAAELNRVKSKSLF